MGSSSSTHLRVQREGAGDADALLLAAGELGRGSGPRGRSRPTCSRSRRASAVASSTSRPCTCTGPSSRFAEDGLVREEVVGLEDHAAAGPERLDLAAPGRLVDGARRSRRRRRRSGRCRRPGSRGRSATAGPWSCPEPDGPSRAVAVPSGAVRSTPLRTWLSPKVFSSPRTSIRASRGHAANLLQSVVRAGPGPARPGSRRPSRRARRAGRAAGTALLDAAAFCASRNISGTRMIEASEVSLISDSSVLDRGGTAIRAACGQHDAPQQLRGSPSRWSVAASYWPRGTERIEARMISAAYPPTLRLRARIAAGTGSIFEPDLAAGRRRR